MNTQKISLSKLTNNDREQFILDNQYAFRYGACEEFGPRDGHFENDGEINSRETIENSIDNGIAYRICEEGKFVGGLVLQINKETGRNHLDLLFVAPDVHSKGIGFAAWQEVERLYPDTKVWETCTPYFEKRNIHPDHNAAGRRDLCHMSLCFLFRYCRGPFPYHGREPFEKCGNT